jgi:hypothetical protein
VIRNDKDKTEKAFSYLAKSSTLYLYARKLCMDQTNLLNTVLMAAVIPCSLVNRNLLSPLSREKYGPTVLKNEAAGCSETYLRTKLHGDPVHKAVSLFMIRSENIQCLIIPSDNKKMFGKLSPLKRG